MELLKIENILVVLVMMTVLAAGVSLALRDNEKVFINHVAAISNSVVVMDVNKPAYVPPHKLSNPPKIVKSIYVTGYSAGSKTYLNYLNKLLESTEINSVVIDIKGSNGFVSYESGAEDVKKYNLSNRAIGDIDALVNFLHGKNIYIIGRIAVFEDSVYAKARPELAVYSKEKTIDLAKPVLWKDKNGLSWLDPAAKEVWDYNISLAKDALYHGFDEINFDYIRFPSDGKAKDMGFPISDGDSVTMAEKIKEFFRYLRSSLKTPQGYPEKISADLFGLTTVNTDDMGIGQLLENAFENFDYLSPMVYPSHYANGFIGFANPAEHPYEVIKYSMDHAIARENIYFQKQKELTSKKDEIAGLETVADQSSSLIDPPLTKFRPWLQDFNMGADYSAEMIQSEIKAVQDSLGIDYSGYMLWNPSNIYTQEAIIKPN